MLSQKGSFQENIERKTHLYLVTLSEQLLDDLNTVLIDLISKFNIEKNVWNYYKYNIMYTTHIYML